MQHHPSKTEKHQTSLTEAALRGPLGLVGEKSTGPSSSMAPYTAWHRKRPDCSVKYDDAWGQKGSHSARPLTCASKTEPMGHRNTLWPTRGSHSLVWARTKAWTTGLCLCIYAHARSGQLVSLSWLPGKSNKQSCVQQLWLGDLNASLVRTGNGCLLTGGFTGNKQFEAVSGGESGEFIRPFLLRILRVGWRPDCAMPCCWVALLLLCLSGGERGLSTTLSEANMKCFYASLYFKVQYLRCNNKN